VVSGGFQRVLATRRRIHPDATLRIEDVAALSGVCDESDRGRALPDAVASNRWHRPSSYAMYELGLTSPIGLPEMRPDVGG